MITRIWNWIAFQALRVFGKTGPRIDTPERKPQTWEEFTDSMTVGVDGSALRKSFEGIDEKGNKRKPKLLNPEGFTDAELQMRQGYLGPLIIQPPSYIGSEQEERDSLDPVKMAQKEADQNRKPTETTGATCSHCFGWGCAKCDWTGHV